MSNDIVTAFRRLIGQGAPAIGLCAGMLVAPAFAQEQAVATATAVDGKVRIDILSLKRSEGETLTLRMLFTNGSNDSYNPTLGNIRLIDMIGRRLYSPGLTSPTCNTPAGQKQVCYAIFGAPPAGTQKLNVQFYEKVELITGVPVSE